MAVYSINRYKNLAVLLHREKSEVRPLPAHCIAPVAVRAAARAPSAFRPPRVSSAPSLAMPHARASFATHLQPRCGPPLAA